MSSFQYCNTNKPANIVILEARAGQFGLLFNILLLDQLSLFIKIEWST